MRVLIVLPGAIGDVVRALPLLGRIRAAWPDASIGWAVEAPAAPVLAAHPWLDRALVFDRRQGGRAFRAFLRRLRHENYELALDLGRGLKSALITWLSGAPRRLGFARHDAREGSWLFANRHLPPQGPGRPKIMQFLAFGDLLGLPAAPVEFGLAPTPAEAQEGAALTAGLDGPLVAACLGSSCPSRYWFPERTAEVLRVLRARHGMSALLLGIAADARFAGDVLRHVDGPVRDLTGRTTLRQLLAVLARSRLAFGPDSGALHLAAAVGVPVASLWGPTSPVRSAPFGSEGLTVSGRAPCAPCFLARCPIDRVCMADIAVDAVVERVDAALDGRAPS